MDRVGLSSTDIMLDEMGQPVVNFNGDFKLIEDDECWLQDIKNESISEEGELFYEDSESTERYGYSLLDFIKAEHDEFFDNELIQRIKEKMCLRSDIDERTIVPTITSDDSNVNISIRFKRNDAHKEYNINVGLNEIEVKADD